MANESILPFKFYNVKNMGSELGLIYVGKVSDADPETAKQFPEEYYADCFTTFTFASIVPGRNILIDPATEIDPSIMVDAKWFDFRPKNFAVNDVADWPYNTVLQNVIYADTGWIKPQFKSITTDGTITINGLETDFVWSDQPPVGSKDYNTFVFQAPKYEVKNYAEPGPYYGMTGIPGKTDVTFYFRSLKGIDDIVVEDLGTALKVKYTKRRALGTCQPCSPPPDNFLCEPPIPADIGKIL